MRLAVIAAILMTSPAAAQTLLDGSLPADAGITLEQLHQSVGAALTDPASAQYRDLVVTKATGNPVLCGMVNWRNASGGYGDFVPFMVIPAGKFTSAVFTDYADPAKREDVTGQLAIYGCAEALGLQSM